MNASSQIEEQIDYAKHRFLIITTSTIGLIGVVATAIPFLKSWEPSAQARALGGPVEVDIGKLEAGAMMRVEWRGQPIYIVNRTAQMLATLDRDAAMLRDPNSNNTDQQPEYAKNEVRSIKPEYLVVIGVCTHLGCAPMARFQPGDRDLGASWPGGFYCPCHGSKFDLAGRVCKDVPAPSNLKIPPYRYRDAITLIVGVDSTTPS